MQVQDLIDELKRFNPHDEVGVELTPQNFVSMDEDSMCRVIDAVEPANVAFDGVRAKLVLGEVL